jgi:hypothetical protein
VPTPLATWNPARGVWETEQASLLCAHWVPFSQTWPNWGTTRAGTAYAQPMWEHLTADSGSSSSPGLLLNTPIASDSQQATADNREKQLCSQVLLMPTPIAAHGEPRNQNIWHRDDPRGAHQLNTALAFLLPTPTADGRDERRPESAGLVGGSDASVSGDGSSADADGDGLEGLPQFHGAAVLNRIEEVEPRGHADRLVLEARGLDWGNYEPAIRRWERCLGRPAPAPTEPGSKGQPRLSPAFVEFLMGLPAGWVTDVPGLSRNDQLKALGNGVVPQQAAAAVRFLLARLAEERRWAA